MLGSIMNILNIYELKLKWSLTTF